MNIKSDHSLLISSNDFDSENINIDSDIEFRVKPNIRTNKATFVYKIHIKQMKNFLSRSYLTLNLNSILLNINTVYLYYYN